MNSSSYYMFDHKKYIQNVEIIHRQKEVPLDSCIPFIPLAISSALALEQQSASYVTVHFLSDRTMRRYHAKYFQDPSSTDCMSFPIDGIGKESTGYRVLGDIFICPKVAQSTAKKEHTSFEMELFLYIIHATLHLLGYDDITVKERRLMRRKERDALKIFTNIYQSTYDRPIF